MDAVVSNSNDPNRSSIRKSDADLVNDIDVQSASNAAKKANKPKSPIKNIKTSTTPVVIIPIPEKSSKARLDLSSNSDIASVTLQKPSEETSRRKFKKRKRYEEKDQEKSIQTSDKKQKLQTDDPAHQAASDIADALSEFSESIEDLNQDLDDQLGVTESEVKLDDGTNIIDIDSQESISNEVLSENDSRFVYRDNRMMYEANQAAKALKETHLKARDLQAYIFWRKTNFSAQQIAFSSYAAFALVLAAAGNPFLAATLIGALFYQSDKIGQMLANLYKRIEYNEKGAEATMDGYRNPFHHRMIMYFTDMVGKPFGRVPWSGIRNHAGMYNRLGEGEAGYNRHGELKEGFDFDPIGWAKTAYNVLSLIEKKYGMPFDPKSDKEVAPDYNYNRTRRESVARKMARIRKFEKENQETAEAVRNNVVNTLKAQYLLNLYDDLAHEAYKVQKTASGKVNGAFNTLKNKFRASLDKIDEDSFTNVFVDDKATWIREAVDLFGLSRRYNPIAQIRDERYGLIEDLVTMTEEGAKDWEKDIHLSPTKYK